MINKQLQTVTACLSVLSCCCRENKTVANQLDHNEKLQTDGRKESQASKVRSYSNSILLHSFTGTYLYTYPHTPVFLTSCRAETTRGSGQLFPSFPVWFNSGPLHWVGKQNFVLRKPP